MDPLGLCLTVPQKMTISMISGLGAAVGTFLGGGPLTSGLLGGAAGAIAAALMEGSTWRDVLSAGVSGLLSGITGAGIGNLFSSITTSGMQAAAITGVISGMTEAVLMGADPPIGKPCP